MNAAKGKKTETEPEEFTEYQLQEFRRVNWLIPNLAIGYVPLVFALIFLSRNDGLSSYEVFVYSGLILMYAIPFYAIILIWNTMKRIRNGTNTLAVTLYQLFSFIILICWLISVVTFNGSPV